MPPNPRDEPPNRDQEFRDHTSRSKPNKCNGPRPATTTKVRSDPWQSVSALQLGIRPRTFPEIHTERMYLLEMLQQHDGRATDLFMRVPIVEEQIRWPESQDAQKQARKLRGWLRHRIVDTVEEEKKVLARLCELHVEIQCRERWSWVEREREMMDLREHQQNSAYASYPTPQPSPLEPYTQANLQYPMDCFYYPFYGYAGPHFLQQGENGPIDENYPGNDWEDDDQATLHNAPENHPEPETFELDTAESVGTLDYTLQNLQWSSETVPGPRPTKHRSMPTLSRKWSG
ncbi:hypothetical protein F5Y05DRAFT_218787 [Hypoxylon sp. FL0543]|nr:hypothetical protein F5Y05DRAFT_218787 [Hypoxylon sp. FL0543]